MIPILIICYNNYQYVENTIQQLNKINSKLLQDILTASQKQLIRTYPFVSLLFA